MNLFNLLDHALSSKKILIALFSKLTMLGSKFTMLGSKFTILTILIILTSSCEDDPKAPTALISKIQTQVPVRDWFSLSGAESINPGGEPIDLQYFWQLTIKPNGSEAKFNDSSLMSPAIYLDLIGDYEVALVVKKGQLSSTQVRAQIKAGPCGAQAPVIADLRIYPSSPGVGSLVELFAVAQDPDESAECGSTSENMDIISVGSAPFMIDRSLYELSYEWKMLSRPVGSQADLIDSLLLTPRFIPDVSGTYLIELQVQDQAGDKSEAKVYEVQIAACGEGQPVIEQINTENMIYRINEAILFSASISDSDENETCGQSQSFEYEWRLISVPAGSFVAFNDPHLASPSFTPDVPGSYQIELIAKDQSNRVSEAFVLTIEVSACGSRIPEITEITIPANLKTGEIVGLSASVTDADLDDPNCPIDQQLSYHWQITSLPANSQASLNQNEIINPSFTADQPGEYAVRLQVTDAQGHQSMPYDLRLTVDPCGSFAPTADISFLPSSPMIGMAVALEIDIQDEDQNCGLMPSHSVLWQLRTVPAGSRSFLTDDSAFTPSFIPDQAGDYEVYAQVTDDRGLTTTVSKIINVSICGGQQPIIQSITHTPEQSGVGQQIVLNATAIDPDDDDACLMVAAAGEMQNPAVGSTRQALKYHWRLIKAPAGATFEINAAIDQTSTFSFTPTRSGQYQFELMVTDETMLSSTPYVYEVVVSNCGEARPEIIDLFTSSTSPRPNVALQLSAQITDQDEICGDLANYDYRWSFRETPIGSIVRFDHSQTSISELSAPSFIPDLPGRYVVRCVIVDVRGLESFKDIIIDVSTCGTIAPVIESIAFDVSPENLAGENLPFVGSTLHLSALISDADQTTTGCEIENRLSYDWTLISKPAGSFTSLNSNQEITPSFFADMPGLYTIRLIARDAQGVLSQAFDQVIAVDVCGSRAPIARATFRPNQPKSGDLIALSLDASDLDETCVIPRLSYEWRMLEMPVGSRAIINQPYALTPSFTTDLPGLYRLMAIVTDETSKQSEPAIVEINVSTCGSNPPQIDTDMITHMPLIINAGQKVSIEASQAISDADTACGIIENYEYHWRITQAPAGSLAQLSLGDTAHPSLTADLPGDYLLEFSVTDLRGLESVNGSYAFTVGSCGLAVPVVTANANTISPSTGELVSLSALVEDADTIAPCQETESQTYLWSFDQVPAGSQARLNVPQAQTPSFVADLPGIYVLRVIAWDARGYQSRPSLITVTANPCGSNAPSIDQINTLTNQIRVGFPVALNVSASDVDTQVGCGLSQTLSYQWRIIQAPAASTAVLFNADTAQPSLIPNVSGLIRVIVEVTDSTGLKTSQTHDITVSTCGVQAPDVSASASTFNTQIASIVDLQALVTDADQTPPCSLSETFRYTWTLLARPIDSQAEIQGNGFANARLVTDAPGNYVTSVIVTDSEGLISNEFILNPIIASNCGGAKPVITQVTTSPAALILGQAVELTPTVIDADANAPCLLSQTFSYHWTVKKRPIASQIMLNQDDLEKPSFIPDVAGTYVFDLQVTDQSNRQSDIFEKTVVLGTCGLQAPIAVVQMTAPSNLPSNSNVAIGSFVQLSAVNSSDPDTLCGVQASLSYRWSLLRMPAGSLANLSLSDGQTPWFKIDALGTYVIRLVVSDGLFNSTAVDFTVTGI